MAESVLGALSIIATIMVLFGDILLHFLFYDFSLQTTQNGTLEK